MLRPSRRAVAVLLTPFAVLAGAMSGCTAWKPAEGIAPREYVTQNRPPLVLIVTTGGDTIRLDRPVVQGDSIVETKTTTHWVEEPIAVPRPPDRDIIALEVSDGRYEKIRVTSATGEPIELLRPTMTADSILGSVRVRRQRRRGVPLADVRAITGHHATSGAWAVSLIVIGAGLTAIMGLSHCCGR